MSAKATVAVFDHGEGSDAEWRMLAVLADAATDRGVVVGVSMEELAARMRKTTRGAGQVKRRLIESGQLIVLEEGGGRGRSAVYWLKLPGLAGPEKPRDGEPGKDAETPNDSVGQPAGGSNTGTTTTSSSSPARGRSLAEELRDADVPDEMRADAESFLHEKKKVGGKQVTPAEMAIAAAAVATWNREFEWEGRKGASIGLGSALTAIVMRVREHPTWDAAKHVRLVESAWRFRWWEQSDRKRRPTPNVIWSEKSFPEVVQDAAEEAAGKKKSERHYTRKRDR
ncbi:MAG: hypothetical protein ACRDPE_09230 [Solirubrobacterales bacterium]